MAQYKPSDTSDLPGRAPVRRFGTREAIRGFGWVVLIAVGSLGLGLAMNRVSSHPLPIIYQSPEQRFDAELTSVINSPPLQIGPGQTIELAEFRAAVDSKSALILDARSSVFFEQGHVPGALNLARDNFAADYQHLSPVLKGMSDKPVIVYCSGGYCHDSRMVAGALMTLGFENVRVFTGGWDEWSAANLPISKGTAQ
jgi:rhodanese-related sulfurtransferase